MQLHNAARWIIQMQIQQHVQLKTLNTLNLNAVASHYVQINSAEDVVNALQFAQQQQQCSSFIWWQ